MKSKKLEGITSDYIGIDLFAGAGGMSLGASQAGIDVRLAVEHDPYAAKTHAYNNRQTKVFVYDIRNVGANELRASDTTLKNKVKVLFGGPPCQGFSTSNIRGRRIDNPINWLFLEYLRILKLWIPDWVVIENVKGLIDTKKGFFLKRIKDDLSDCGYTISQWVLNSADFGVPQKRNRLFIIGSLHGKTLEKPKPTVTKYITVKEAISDLPNLKNGASENIKPYKCEAKSQYARQMRGSRSRCANHLVTKNAPIVIERYKYIPQGRNWENIPDELMKNYKNKNNCHTKIYYRLKEDEPSVVLGNYRKNMLIHPTQDRGLSVREAARLQSFPDSYDFFGSIGFQQQQVANAVPPLLAEVVFLSIQSKR
ncbi:MAG: DNA cytosine methyltransferase [Candidatus Aminicenantes bacterium]|nr:MAG: DNA cytosine methyltransferase [Candidatus Aminicenantes bacterium]